MKSKKKISKPAIVARRKPVGVPTVVFEYVIMQLILRGSGFKSSELETIVKECKDDPKKTSVHLIISRTIEGAVKRHMFGIGTVNWPLKRVQPIWTRWLTLASTIVVKNFDAWQKKSIAYSSMEAILSSLEEAGFKIEESPIDKTFDLTGTIH